MMHFRKIAMWLIFNIPMGKIAPIVFGFAIGAKHIKRIK